jgi:hypothetical protein
MTMASRADLEEAPAMHRTARSALSLVGRHLVTGLTLALALGACTAETAEPQEDTSADNLVGGKPDARFPAAGYLVHGATFEDARRGAVACGATLVAPNVVVTAAHCVQNAPKDVWAFGTGDLGSAVETKVVSVDVHPQFHPAPTSSFDVKYFLKNFDVATLVLEKPIAGVLPAKLPSAKASVGCAYTLLGYRAEKDARGRRVSTPGCVEFRITLGEDPIFEMHPVGASALCHGDGDEGSPAITGEANAPVLHGIYVGSVTQGITDCRRGTQFLNGYEAMFGFRDFVESGIEKGKKRL